MTRGFILLLTAAALAGSGFLAAGLTAQAAKGRAKAAEKVDAAGDKGDEAKVDAEADGEADADADAKQAVADKIKSAQILLDNEDYKGAKRLLVEARTADRTNAEVVVLLGRCEENLGDTQAALEHYERAIEMLGEKPAGSGAALRREAAKAAARLDEGAKIVAKYVAMMERDAKKLKGKNDHAYKTVMNAVRKLDDGAPDAVSAGGGRPADAKRFNGHYYKRFEQKLTWHMAKRACERMGGYLACVESKEEAAFVARLGKSWLGATDEEREGDWQWLNGSPFEAWAWVSGQPDNYGDGEHGLFTDPDGKWGDASRELPMAYVCEWEE